jgi:hypothetical protein
MIKMQIEELREKLYKLLDSNVDFDEVYKVSVKLDELIVRYYNEVYLNPKLNNNYKR